MWDNITNQGSAYKIKGIHWIGSFKILLFSRLIRTIVFAITDNRVVVYFLNQVNSYR